MAYNLIIDQGNSRAKVAIFDKWQIVKQWQFNQLTTSDIDTITHSYPIEAAIDRKSVV